MKTRILTILLLAVLLAGCAASTKPAESVQTEITTEENAAAAVIRPLPDTTMEAIENAIVHISFRQEDLYRDTSGNMILKMQIYAYDKFDMVDISGLKAGDTILLSGEEIAVHSVDRNDHGTVLVNGGLEEGGFDLATDDSGVYFVHGYSDMKSWDPVGEVECSVSNDFIFTDSADLELGAVPYSIEDLLNGVPDPVFGYQPQNTTVRIENGQIVEMNRVYTP